MIFLITRARVILNEKLLNAGNFLYILALNKLTPVFTKITMLRREFRLRRAGL